MKALSRLTSAIDRLTDALGWISQLLAFATVMLTFYNVVVRYLGEYIGVQLSNNSLLESSWYLYSLVFFLSFAYIVRHGVNVRVDFIYGNWSKKRKARLDFWGNIVCLFPFLIMGIIVSWPSVMTSWGRIGDSNLIDGIIYLFTGEGNWGRWEVSPDPGGLPRAPIKSMIIIAFVLLLLQAIVEQIKLWATLSDNEQYFDIEEDSEAPIRLE